MAPAAELSRPPRIPKLTYRNRLPADDLSLISRTSSTSTDASSQNILVDRHLSAPVCMPPPAPEFDGRSIASTQSPTASLASSDGSSTRDSKTSSTKKKKNSVLSFLSLKEPSQSALDQFADAQRKKGGLQSPVGMQGVSPQRLPSTVPKVNSKWNGVPTSAKSSRNSIISSKRTSMISTVSSQGSQRHAVRTSTLQSSAASITTINSQGPPNSLASPMHSALDVSAYMPKSPPRVDSPSSASLAEMTSFFPHDPSVSVASPRSSAEHPWSPPARPDQDPSQIFVTDFDEKISISEPDIADVDKADAILRRLNGGAGEALGEYYEEDDQDPDVPDTHDFLFDVKPILASPPPRTLSHQAPVQPVQPAAVPRYVPPGKPQVANFSRPRPVQTFSNPPRASIFPHHHKYGSPALPTLYEASIASTDDTDADSDTTDIGRSRTRDSTDSAESFSAQSIAPSMAPSVATSFTPSVMSASWYRSSRDRLGLGGIIRKSEALPWEQTEQRGKPKKSRLSVFSRG